MGRCYASPRKKTELHQAVASLGGQFQTVKDRLFTVREIEDGGLGREAPALSLLETQLHNTFRIGQQFVGVKGGAGRAIRLLHKPRTGGRIGLEEVQHQLRDLRRSLV